MQKIHGEMQLITTNTEPGAVNLPENRRKHMWRISYLNLLNDEVEQKGGFKSDKDAIEWADKQESEQNIIALKLLVWS